MQRFLRFGLLLSLGLGATAVKAGHNQDTSSESWSGVSGQQAAHQHTVLTNGDYFALRALKFYDYDSRACLIEIGQASMNGGTLGEAGKLKACEPKSAEAWKNLDVGSNVFITSIEVCTQKLEDGSSRIRGVRVQGASIQPDGKLKPSKAKTSISFAGCKTWQPRKSCPKGAVATGIRASYDDPANGYTGLELRCHKPKQTAGSD